MIALGTWFLFEGFYITVLDHAYIQIDKHARILHANFYFTQYQLFLRHFIDLNRFPRKSGP